MTEEAHDQEPGQNPIDSRGPFLGPPSKETRAQKLKQTSAHAAIPAGVQAKRRELERLQAALDAAEDCEPLGETYHRDVEIAKKFGVARTTIWRWVQAGILPPPIKFSEGCSRWPGAVVHGLAKRRSA